VKFTHSGVGLKSRLPTSQENVAGDSKTWNCQNSGFRKFRGSYPQTVETDGAILPVADVGREALPPIRTESLTQTRSGCTFPVVFKHLYTVLEPAAGWNGQIVGRIGRNDVCVSYFLLRSMNLRRASSLSPIMGLWFRGSWATN